jgi:hypothetical protein
MKVLDLQCQHGHAFEGWFGSESDFQTQLSSGLVECPLCGDHQVAKLLSAPRLNLSTSLREPALATSENTAVEPAAPAPDPNSATMAQMNQAWMKVVQHVMQNTEDVGSGFAEEARKIHYGEKPERNIRGQVTATESQALHEEGIAVVSLPIPAALKGSVH